MRNPRRERMMMPRRAIRRTGVGGWCSSDDHGGSGPMRTSERETETASVPGHVVDRRMAAYLHAVRSGAISRRRLLGQAAAVTMVAAASQRPRAARARPRMQEET